MLETINNLDIGPNILELYQRMAYTESMAIAELIDNSIHAHYLNEDDLDSAKIFVTINNKSLDGGPYVSISDNCGGMTEEDIKRLTQLGTPKPADQKGRYQLSKYGIGLKSSSLWIGKKITIETYHYSSLSANGYKVEIDLSKIHSPNGYVSITTLGGISKGTTKIKIENLNRPFGTKTIKKVREDLAAIYEFYIKSGVRINLDGTDLGPMEEMTFLHDAGENPRYREYTTIFQGKSFDVRIGALHPAKQSTTGVRYYHNHRLLKGHPISSNFRPGALASWTGDLIQRLICNIDVSELTPTHTKDDVVDPTEFTNGLFSQIRNENKEIISAASSGLRTTPTTGPSEPDEIQTVQEVLDEIVDGGVIDPAGLNLHADFDPDFQSLPKKFREFAQNNSPIHESIFSHEDINFNYQVFLTKSDISSPCKPHVFCDGIDEDVVKIHINLNPPFRNYFPEFKNYIVTCAIEGLTEIYLTKKSTSNLYNEHYPTTFRIYFNDFLNNFRELNDEIWPEDTQDNDE